MRVARFFLGCVMGMIEQIEPLLDLVQQHDDRNVAWQDTIALCRKAYDDGPWDVLPDLDLNRDTAAAVAWLNSDAGLLSKSHGIYLGLDTLNMREGTGMNVEMGYHSTCDATSDSIDWVYERLHYGTHHLICGLYEIDRVFSEPKWTKAKAQCEYLYFLGYSGIVFAAAFQEVVPENTCVAVWGFHGGDLFALGRRTKGGIARMRTRT